jgi:hypothetical protein
MSVIFCAFAAIAEPSLAALLHALHQESLSLLVAVAGEKHQLKSSH